MAVVNVDLNGRRKSLKMPLDVLVKRSGVPRRTVVRLLRGRMDAVPFGFVQNVGRVLGLTLGDPTLEPEELRRHEAQRKARLLVRLTQGTMGLEAQAVASEVLEQLEAQTVARLLAGPGRKLWSE